MRIVYMGSGAFGLPTLEHLLAGHELALVVTQPSRPAGRGQRTASTPIGERALGQAPVIRPEDVNAAAVVEAIRRCDAEALVVVAFGQKLGPTLLDGIFAVNLHGSLLPRHRGAAPVNWSILAGDDHAGVTAITLASRMDAGAMLGAVQTPIDPGETAGELHDRLAMLGAPLIDRVLRARAAGALVQTAQDDSLATRAPKLSRADAWLRFDASADDMRRRVHGLTPWPGVAVQIGERQVRLLRVEACGRATGDGPARCPGELLADGTIACGDGAIRVLEVQPAGGRPMTWDAFQRGHRIDDGTVVTSCVTAPQH